MRVKFLVPEIDKAKWSEDLLHKKEFNGLTAKDLENIGAEVISAQSINTYIHRKSLPSMDRFMSICRFFVTSPDYFLSAKPKWIECEISDISKFSVFGKFENTYHIVPMRESKGGGNACS